MEKRAEPRFAVASRVVLVPLNKPNLEIEGNIRDVSAGGIRIQTSLRLESGQEVLIETEHHLVLGEVRHTGMTGVGYLLGVQRLKEISKLDVPESASRAEQIRMLKNGGAAPAEPPPASLFPLPPAAATSEQPVQAPATAALPLPPPILPELAATPLAAAPLPSPRRGKRLPLWALVTVAFVLAAIVVASLVQRQSRASESQTPIVVEGPPQPQPAPPAVTANTFRVTARDAAWLAVNIDGKPVFAHMLAKGESHEFEFANYAHVHLGNALRVDVSASVGTISPITDGYPLRLLELTPSGVAVLPWRNTDPPPPELGKKP
jgi:hypothetical protein